MSLIIAMLMLGIIIMIHEFGHFLFAKLNGIGVIEFSLGMGPRLFSFEKGGTRYSFKILPFGGSCMMLGEDEGITDESAFNNKSVWARISVVAAGPVFNFLLAFILSLVLVGALGYNTTKLLSVTEGYPAQLAGLQAGDVITSVNGRKVHSFDEFKAYLFTHPQKDLDLTWHRTDPSGKQDSYSARISPVYSKDSGSYVIGVAFDAMPKAVQNPTELLVQGLYQVRFQIQYVFDTLSMMVRGMVSLNDISGPVGIVVMIDDSVKAGLTVSVMAAIMNVLSMCILLSANLGIMNLLPIPALDGGRLLFLIIEAVRGKRMDPEKEGMVNLIGMMALMALMVFVVFNDISRFT